MKRPFWQTWQFVVIGGVLIGVTTGVIHNINSGDDNKTTQAQTVSTKAATQEVKKTETKSYQPKEIAEFNHAYIGISGKNPDGSKPAINISKVEKKDGNIIVTCGAPGVDLLQYAINNFISVMPKDAQGNILDIKNISTNMIDSDNTEIVIAGTNLDSAKWVQIGPYITSNKNPITFEIK